MEKVVFVQYCYIESFFLQLVTRVVITDTGGLCLHHHSVLRKGSRCATVDFLSSACEKSKDKKKNHYNTSNRGSDEYCPVITLFVVL